MVNCIQDVKSKRDAGGGREWENTRNRWIEQKANTHWLTDFWNERRKEGTKKGYRKRNKKKDRQPSKEYHGFSRARHLRSHGIKYGTHNPVSRVGELSMHLYRTFRWDWKRRSGGSRGFHTKKRQNGSQYYYCCMESQAIEIERWRRWLEEKKIKESQQGLRLATWLTSTIQE